VAKQTSGARDPFHARIVLYDLIGAGVVFGKIVDMTSFSARN